VAEEERREREEEAAGAEEGKKMFASLINSKFYNRWYETRSTLLLLRSYCRFPPDSSGSSSAELGGGLGPAVFPFSSSVPSQFRCRSSVSWF
jgi:hypothetical protein